jgi:hypothetical protein
MQTRAAVQTPWALWPARLSRLAARWWGRLPPSRQDRLATIGPLVSVVLFLAAITSAFWYLRQEEMSRELESVVRDTEITQQRVGWRGNWSRARSATRSSASKPKRWPATAPRSPTSPG